MNEITPSRVKQMMKHKKVVIRWREGLHLRQAAELVRVGQNFRSKICLKCCGRIADLRSILSIIALCATMGTSLDLEAVGDDEQDAAQAVELVFSAGDRGEA